MQHFTQICVAFQLLHFYHHQTNSLNSNCTISDIHHHLATYLPSGLNATPTTRLITLHYVAFQLLHFFTIHQTPNSNCTIETTTSYLLTIWAICNTQHLSTMAFQLLHFFTIHQTPNSNCTSSSTTTSYLLTIWAKLTPALHTLPCVAFQLLHFFTIHQTPNSNCTI